MEIIRKKLAKDNFEKKKHIELNLSYLLAFFDQYRPLSLPTIAADIMLQALDYVCYIHHLFSH